MAKARTVERPKFEPYQLAYWDRTPARRSADGWEIEWEETVSDENYKNKIEQHRLPDVLYAIAWRGRRIEKLTWVQSKGLYMSPNVTVDRSYVVRHSWIGSHGIMCTIGGMQVEGHYYSIDSCKGDRLAELVFARSEEKARAMAAQAIRDHVQWQQEELAKFLRNQRKAEYRWCKDKKGFRARLEAEIAHDEQWLQDQEPGRDKRLAKNED